MSDTDKDPTKNTPSAPHPPEEDLTCVPSDRDGPTCCGFLIPAGELQPAADDGLGESEDGDLVLTVWGGEDDDAGLEPEVTDDSSHGERGRRLNHGGFFSMGSSCCSIQGLFLSRCCTAASD